MFFIIPFFDVIGEVSSLMGRSIPILDISLIAKIVPGMLSPLRLISRVGRGLKTSNIKNIPLKGGGDGEMGGDGRSLTALLPCSPAPELPSMSPQTAALWALLLISWAISPESALGLPPPEDIPEEILRSGIITKARSPIDGQPMTAAEYAQLIQTQPELEPAITDASWEASMAESPDMQPEPEVSPPAPLPNIIDWLSIRDLLRRVFPF